MLEFVARNPEAPARAGRDWFSALLAARGADTPEKAEAFLRPSLEGLGPPRALSGMAEALALIERTRAAGQRAVVYGDYDADGICGAVILKEALEAFGIAARIHIPDRHSQGYGLNSEAVRRLAREAELLVTADCGITNVEEVGLARELGMRVIVTDHHQPPPLLPPADVLVNPLLGDPPGPPLCGAGVAWKLSLGLMGEEFAFGQLDLAGLATIADMVPLTGENRILAFHGLLRLAKSGRPGLQALMDRAGIRAGGPVSAEQVGFQLAPRLNAGGRLTDAEDAVRLLLTRDGEEADLLAGRLESLNQARKGEEARVREEARRALAREDLAERRTVVLASPGWNIGVLGLVAGRLAEETGYPVAVLTLREGQYTGSARSAGGIDLHGALSGCAELLSRFGGHRQAAGLTLPLENLEAFRQRFDGAVREQLAGRELLPRVYYDLELPPEAVTPESARRLEALAPFGTDNPAPEFLARDVPLGAADAVGSGGEHLRLRLGRAGGGSPAIFFGAGHRAASLPPLADIVYRPTLSEYRGRESLQLRLRALEPGTEAFFEDEAGESLAILSDLMRLPASEAAPEAEPFDGRLPGLPRGLVLLCRTKDCAEALRRKYPGFAAVTGGCHDRRAYNAVVYRSPLSGISAPVRCLIFCDGLVHPLETALARQLFPEARLMAGPRSPALQKRLDRLAMDRDGLRDAYRNLRDGLKADGTDPVRAMAAVAVLAELGLVSAGADLKSDIRMLPMRRTDPDESRIFRLIAGGG